MNSEARDYLKITLLAVIAGCLVYGTFFKKSKSRRSLKQPQITNQSTQNNNTFQDQNLSVGIDPGKNSGVSHTYGATGISWDKQEHNFGRIEQHTENDHIFTFTNTGEEPLVIESAEGSCGCTVPQYPKSPILPGETGEIRVKYSPGSQIGAQTKSITITSNANPKVQNLYLKAIVDEAPDPLLE